MNKTDYKEKLASMVNNGTYSKLKRNPAPSTERKLTKILKKNKDRGYLTDSQYRYLNQHHSKVPHIYGLPKIHKQDVPLRPIVSCRGSACHPLSQFLVKIINPLSGKTPSYVKNSTHFVSLIKDISITSDTQMVSFDVVSLFTKVPTSKALAEVRKKLESDETLAERTGIPVDNIMELLTFCLTTTAFQLDESYYQQNEGMAMGSPLSPVMANIYMEHFEQEALETAPLKPSLWLRYVDDTFVLWQHQEDATSLLDHLNSIESDIQFTMEKEKDQILPFLDVKVEKTEHGFSTGVYHKPTSTGRYLNFESNHPDSIKRGIVKCLQHRVKNISTDERKKNSELSKLTETMQRNGYPKGFLTCKKKTVTSEGDSNSQQAETPVRTVSLPYTKGLSEKIQRICQKYNIRTIFKSNNTLRGQLCRVKPPNSTGNTKNCIYNIPCSCGKSYTGETGRPLSVRLEEHRKATIRGEVEKSGMAEHAWSNGDHRPAWDETKIIGREQHWKIRKIKEAVHMALDANSISKPSAEISPIWIPVLRGNKTKGTSNTP